jgi:epoxide hydrolase-like predicted phosphatase
MRPDEAMLHAVSAARRAGVRTGLVSNSWGRGRYDRSQFPDLFDGVVISGEEGIRKPDPRIYELGAARIGLDAEACVFVDDLPGNLKPARALGMATVHHVGADSTVPLLERLLGVPLRADGASHAHGLGGGGGRRARHGCSHRRLREPHCAGVNRESVRV